jgi:hypothetical protein
MGNIGGGIAVAATYAFAGFIAWFAREGGVVNFFPVVIFILLTVLASAGTWRLVFRADT